MLQKLSFLNNDKDKNLLEIQKYKFDWMKNRLLPINLLGETHWKNSNRNFNFDFTNQTIVYKPNRNTKIELKYTCYKNQQRQLFELQEIKDSKVLPISIKLSNEYIFLSYDEEILKGFALDISSRTQEVKKINNEHVNVETKKILISEIYKKYHREHDNRRLQNKITTRYLSIDLNPLNIGCSILNKNQDDSLKIIKTWNYDLSNYSTKLKLNSEDKKQKYQNNKRKFEIYQIIRQIFKIAVSYKVGHFVMEDLEFKQKVIKDTNKEFNRKTKNLWYRTIINNSITKLCNELGIIKTEINPVYSSFIGNIKYKYFDSINASIEIGRRGIFKFQTGSLFPVINQTDIDTMSNLIERSNLRVINQENEVRDVQFLTCDLVSWKGWFDLLKQREIKYRWDLESCTNRFQIFSLNSKKSKILNYEFYN